MNNCLFCKIIAKEIPSTPVYEDDHVYAFLDIHPVHPGHVLVVPTQHTSGFLEADPSLLDAWIRGAQKIARAVKIGTGADGINLLQNEGAVAGQVIPHLHLHIIPRFANDGLRHWPSQEYASEEEKKALAEKIRMALY